MASSRAFAKASTQYYTFGSTATTAFIQNTLVFTISLWVKLNDNATGYALCGNTNTSARKGFWLYYRGDSDDGLWFFASRGVSGQPTQEHIETTAAFSDGNWHHIAITGDGTNTQFYVDGSTYGSANAKDNALSSGNSAGAPAVGAANNGLGSYWGHIDGNLSDVRFYDVELSAQEISNIYNGQMLSQYGEGDLIFWQKYDDLTDRSGNGVSITNSGSTASADAPKLYVPMLPTIGYSVTPASGGGLGTRTNMLFNYW